MNNKPRYVAIVSVSLNDKILSELDSYQRLLGFSGRSEIIRAGIRAFVSDEKQKSKMTGKINAILLVVHDDEYDNIASEIGNEYEDLVTTRMHSKIEGKKCMELFVLKGDAKDISNMTKKYTVNKHMDSTKIIMI